MSELCFSCDLRHGVGDPCFFIADFMKAQDGPDLEPFKERREHGHIDARTDIDAYRAAGEDIDILIAEIERLRLNARKP